MTIDELTYALKRAEQLRDEARATARRAMNERDEALRERDTTARALSRALAVIDSFEIGTSH